MENDPYLQARGLMDLIGGKESSNDYNVAYGGTKDKFTDMTVDEILDWQKNYVKQGSPSSAVGRYQIITKTLKDLKKNLGLKGDEKFDEDLQDRMFMSLLERRGYGDWTQGNLTDEQFADQLAKEWASLPVMATGRSYYDKDGLNKALISPEAVLQALSVNRPEYMTMDELLGAHDYFGTLGNE